jgi:hypothetical protein
MPDVKRVNTITEKQRDYWIYESVKDKRFEDCYEAEGEMTAYDVFFKYRIRYNFNIICLSNN